MKDYYNDSYQFEYSKITEYDFDGNLVYTYPKIYGEEAPLFDQLYTKEGILYYVYNGTEKIKALSHI